VTEQSRKSYVPAALAIEAMRDNGYKNTATAVAELIDNSIQAGASNVELMCLEEINYGMKNPRARISCLGILDNGRGMTADELTDALQFGNGSRLKDRSGMGRFGMGLPSSSISQARRVDVWSWRKSGLVIHTYLDLDDLGDGVVPDPQESVVPAVWLDAATGFGKSGTLVVWSKLDRVVWRTAEALIKNSEFLIGRMYRKFLHSGDVAIRMSSFLADAPKKPVIDRFAKANDPGYLMDSTSTPDPYSETAMFDTWGNSWEVPFVIEYSGSAHTVYVRYSMVKPVARKADYGKAAGAKDYGQHAKRNVGVSLIRAGRELALEQTLIEPSEPRERWWGVEVEFPPALDEIFGVPNNKQEARNFTAVAQDLKADNFEGSFQDRLDYLVDAGDLTESLYVIVNHINGQLNNIRKLLRASGAANKQSKGKPRHDTPEEVATAATNERKDENYRGESDEGENIDPSKRKDLVKDEFDKEGIDDAEKKAGTLIDSGIKYVFLPADLEGTIFFTVRPVAGEIFIKINTNHAAYENLIEVLEEPSGIDVPREELVERLLLARDGLKLLLMSWARYEDEANPSNVKAAIQDMRTAWGRIAADFLKNAR